MDINPKHVLPILLTILLVIIFLWNKTTLKHDEESYKLYIRKLEILNKLKIPKLLGPKLVPYERIFKRNEVNLQSTDRIIKKDPYFYSKNSLMEYEKSGHQDQNSNLKSKVIVLTEQRSGSTFVSEIFNRNSKAFYLFEPIYSLGIKYQRPWRDYNYLTDSNNKTLQNDDILKYLSWNRQAEQMIYDLYVNCNNFNTTKLFLNTVRGNIAKIKGKVNYGLNGNQQSAKVRGYPFGGKSLFVDTEYKEYTRRRKTAAVSNKGGKIPPTWNLNNLKTLCLSQELLATKIIRLDSLEFLKPTIEASENTYILYFVRDPRATLKSRINLGNTVHNRYRMSNKKNQHYKICRVLNRNINYIENLEGKVEASRLMNQSKRPGSRDPRTLEKNWLEKKLIIIRYEDFSMDPILFTKLIYKYINFNSYQEVLDWLEENVVDTDHEKYDKTRSGGFSTKKDSTRVVYSWMEKVSFEYVREVQNYCGRKVFDKFAWKWFESFEEFNKSSVSVSDENWFFDKENWRAKYS